MRRLEARFLDHDVESQLRARRSAALLDAAKQAGSDTLLIHQLRFDMPALRSGFAGRIIYWDVDGPAGDLSQGRLPDGVEVDHIFSVSRPIVRALEESTTTPAHYLPSGVSTQFYRPGTGTPDEEKRFGSAIAFLGQPTARRIAMLESLTKKDLVLWGRRWTKACREHPELVPCIREQNDLVGKEVAALYGSAGIVVDISRECFVNPPTVLGLPVFQVPASGGCLLTEWVEELEAAFEPGVEMLAFHNADELVELADRYTRDREARKRIGIAGRKRCEAQHTLRARVESMKRFID